MSAVRFRPWAPSFISRYTRQRVTIEASELDTLEGRIGYRFENRDLLLRSLTHRSHYHESRGRGTQDNETFEFLGDSVLGFVIGDALFRQFPELQEGALSKMKAYLVSSPILARKAKAFEMGTALMLGVGEAKSGGNQKDSLLANLFEAIIAAIYLDSGIENIRRLILEWFSADLLELSGSDLLLHDYKTALQEAAQADGLPLPSYQVVGEIGPDHQKRFVVEVKLTNSVVARGEGSSKKEAQQQAAMEALRLHESLHAQTHPAAES